MRITPLSETAYRWKRFQPLTGNQDRLVFTITPQESTSINFRAFTLKGDLTLTDKLVAAVGRGESLLRSYLNEPLFTVRGPYYMGSLDDPTVTLPPWSNFREFHEVMELEFLKRRDFCFRFEDDGLPEVICGRALDGDEFEHLYLTQDQKAGLQAREAILEAL